jgi:putative membrane protein
VSISSLPALNATLNAIAALLITTAIVLVKNGRRDAHRNVMLAAVVTSVLFLASYLYYHFHAGVTRFPGTGPARAFYFSILISHTILAATVPVLVVLTLIPAFQRRFARHRRLAHWTAPIWLYVSVTGVVIYVMLYRMSW